MKKLIEMKNVTKTFNQNGEKIDALKKTNFTAYAGEMVAIVGPSGSGKSTFLTILGGLQSPTGGKVLINNKPFSELNKKQRSRIRFKNIGFILQEYNLIPFLTVKQQMLIYDKIEKRKLNTSWLNELFAKLDIFRLTNKYPNALSGGERQRVAIAKALYHKPSVIFADEPTANLDTKRAFEVIKLLARETKLQKKATIIVTHDERLVEFCDKVYHIIDGELSLTQDKSQQD